MTRKARLKGDTLWASILEVERMAIDMAGSAGLPLRVFARVKKRISDLKKQFEVTDMGDRNEVGYINLVLEDTKRWLNEYRETVCLS